jgi:AraC family ethanolamine operon transcriptional activator
MFSVETQESHSFEDLTTIQYGWRFSVSQLGPSEEVSSVTLYQTPHIGYTRSHYSAAYDQRLHARKGMLSFGLLDPDNPATWAYNQLIPNNALTVFPHEEDFKAASPAGFRGNGMHFSEDFMVKLAEQIYKRPLGLLVPEAGIYTTSPEILLALRKELHKWQQLATYGANVRPAIVARREESLALAVIDALIDEKYFENESSSKSERSMSLALEIIHDSELENISAAELCKHAGCSQRLLERSFIKRFSVTPKKYIKCLRLAQVNRGLRNFEAQDCESIIELAGIQGFWHMGQFAADYRRIYGELPSATLNRRSRSKLIPNGASSSSSSPF